jgi:hypothetical protein
MTNPYKISQEILKTYSMLNNLSYELFETLDEENKRRLNSCLTSLLLLSSSITRQADKLFEEN